MFTRQNCQTCIIQAGLTISARSTNSAIVAIVEYLMIHLESICSIFGIHLNAKNWRGLRFRDYSPTVDPVSRRHQCNHVPFVLVKVCLMLCVHSACRFV